MMTTEQMKALPLSTDTAFLLATMTLLQDLWDEVHKALENFYGSEARATEVMERRSSAVGADGFPLRAMPVHRGLSLSQ